MRSRNIARHKRRKMWMSILMRKIYFSAVNIAALYIENFFWLSRSLLSTINCSTIGATLNKRWNAEKFWKNRHGAPFFKKQADADMRCCGRMLTRIVVESAIDTRESDRFPRTVSRKERCERRDSRRKLHIHAMHLASLDPFRRIKSIYLSEFCEVCIYSKDAIRENGRAYDARSRREYKTDNAAGPFHNRPFLLCACFRRLV
jgi:hypothetical protein